MELHPNVHDQWRFWSQTERLHVVAVYTNPLRWRTRREHMNDFRQHMATSPNVALHVVELAYGDRPFEVTDADNPLDIQLRTSCELWHKENLTNIAVSRFPANWRYGAQVDTDFHFTRPDWALETIHQLQHHAWAQLFSSYSALSGRHVPVRILPSFAWSYLHYRPGTSWKSSAKAAPPSIGGRLAVSGGTPRSASWPDNPGATGGAWAFTRQGFETVGGFLDCCILGSADWHMAFGLAREPDNSIEMRQCGPAYVSAIRRWQDRAGRIEGNIGCVENHAVHYFHGSYKLRGYGDRWQVLKDNAYDPLTDIQRDYQGVLVLSGNKSRLRDDIRAYLRSRDEDATELSGERHLV
jgi:hypothetical protein